MLGVGFTAQALSLAAENACPFVGVRLSQPLAPGPGGQELSGVAQGFTAALALGSSSQGSQLCPPCDGFFATEPPEKPVGSLLVFAV